MRGAFRGELSASPKRPAARKRFKRTQSAQQICTLGGPIIIEFEAMTACAMVCSIRAAAASAKDRPYFIALRGGTEGSVGNLQPRSRDFRKVPASTVFPRGAWAQACAAIAT